MEEYMFSFNRMCNPKNTRHVLHNDVVSYIDRLAIGEDEAYLLYLDIMLIFDLESEGVEWI